MLNLLSIGASYGVIVAIFQWGWRRSLLGIDQSIPVVSFVPMMMFAVLFGLSMDYEVFLLSRVREAYLKTGNNVQSVVTGISTTARVITSAALIMIAVFLSFVTQPDPVAQMFGIGLAMAVLIDATIVRVVLVPATMVLLGDANWWLPGWLDRILPKMQSSSKMSPNRWRSPCRSGRRFWRRCSVLSAVRERLRSVRARNDSEIHCLAPSSRGRRPSWPDVDRARRSWACARGPGARPWPSDWSTHMELYPRIEWARDGTVKGGLSRPGAFGCGRRLVGLVPRTRSARWAPLFRSRRPFRIMTEARSFTAHRSLAADQSGEHLIHCHVGSPHVPASVLVPDFGGRDTNFPRLRTGRPGRRGRSIPPSVGSGV